MSEPVFAVVGHPNKGKSSLVATLARDDAVGIGPDPGTTTRARRYPMVVDGRTLYALVDTPGFQRARAALDWMQRQATDAASRPAVVARFVAEHRAGGAFPDECELLGPIVDGAAILYVVDGARPYGPEYEAEMEILRWTGRPSLAVINPIGSDADAPTIAGWRQALGQFFKVVRVMDAVHAPFEQRLNLLRAFAELDESWRPALEEAVAALVADRRRRMTRAAEVIAEMLIAALTLVVERRLGEGEAVDGARGPLEELYRGRLRQLERACRDEVEAVFDHHGLDRSEPEFDALQRDLLHEDTWLAFGLKRRDLVAAGAAGGALAGGMIDASLLGSSFLAGTVLGALAGGAAGYFSAGRLMQVRVLRQPLGGRLLRCGPASDPNLPFVLLGRARLHARVVAQRTHARRDRLVLAVDTAGGMNRLTAEQRRALAALFRRAARAERGGAGWAAVRAELAGQVETLVGDGGGGGQRPAGEAMA